MNGNDAVTKLWYADCPQAIQIELQRALRKQEKSREDERAMYRRMVEGGLGTTPRQRATSRQQEWVRQSPSFGYLFILWQMVAWQ